MPELIYLDQLHWIGLSKARLRQEAGSYVDLLAELRAAVKSGRSVVPLSFTHYFEVSQIASAQRRADLALTMCELSKYATLAPREVFLRDQFRRSLAKELGVGYRVPHPAVTGYGAAHAFGEPPFKGPLSDNPIALKQFAASLDKFISRLEKDTGYGWRFVPSGTATSALDLVTEAIDRHAQFRVLMGPADKQDPELLKFGFNPASAYEVVENIRRREEDLAEQLGADPSWQRRLDDIIEARALLWDLNEDWGQAITDVWSGRPITIEELGMERLHRILSDIPIVDVESSIRHANFRNGSHKWTTNDIHDLGFAGQAVTRCDVVLTEKHLHADLNQVGLKYGTGIFRRPEELTAHLRGSSP